MEWTKETLVNTCIEVSKRYNGKKIIKFYESFGFKNNHNLVGDSTIGYYGILEENNSIIFHNIPLLNVIKLPSKPRRKFPREMMVSEDGHEWFKSIVFGTIKHEYGKFVIRRGSDSFRALKYAKEI
jgi:hypothetical protein